MSKTDKTAPFWTQPENLVAYHDHRTGPCDLPPKPVNKTDAQNALARGKGRCCWEPKRGYKWARPRRFLRNYDDWFSPEAWGGRRRERMALREALMEESDVALPDYDDDVVTNVIEDKGASTLLWDTDRPTREELRYCRTCGEPYLYRGIDYCYTHRDDD